MVRKVSAGIAAVLAVLCWSAAAWAHVTVQPSEAPKGSFTEISFRVPNEESNASTTELRVQMPVGHPIASVSIKPLEGWTATTKTEKVDPPLKTDDDEVSEAVTEITWRGGTIEPGQYQDFSISAGPLPDDVDELVFKALQTYSDGDVVRWIDETPPGGPEPDHPAPVLKLTAATGDEHGAGGTETTTTAASDGTKSASGVTVAAVQDDVDDANTRANIAIVVGAAGLIAGVAGIVLGRRRRT